MDIKWNHTRSDSHTLKLASHAWQIRHNLPYLDTSQKPVEAIVILSQLV